MSAIKLIPASGGGSVSLSPPSSTSGTDITVTLPTASTTLGRILNVWNDLKADTSSTSSTSFVDIGNLDLTVSPASTSSKFLITATLNLCYNNTGGYDGLGRLVKVISGTTTPIGNSTSSPNGESQNGFLHVSGQNSTFETNCGTVTYLDSPNTTSNILYKVQFKSASGSYTCYCNRRVYNDWHTSSSLTVIELAS